MRILSWVQNKFSGNQEKKRFDAGSCSSRRTSIPDDRKEEFSDWPQSLLAIGTLGNTNLNDKEDTERSVHDYSTEDISNSSQDDPLDFSIEEVVKLQKELTELLSHKPKKSTDGSATNLPLNRFLNCPSTLEVDRREEDIGELSPNSKIILSKARDILADKHNTIRKKLFSFLLKKVFVCSSGFAPAPSLRDQLSETKMEKLMRVLIHKKTYPQSSTARSAKRYLETKSSTGKLEYKEKEQEKEDDGCKWVKTDSDFIVLEM